MHIMFNLPRQRMDNGQEFTNIIGTFFIWTRTEDLLACFRIYAPKFQLPRRSAAGGIHTHGGQYWFYTCFTPFSAGGRFPLIVFVLRQEGSIGLRFTIKRLELRINKSFDLLFTFPP